MGVCFSCPVHNLTPFKIKNLSLGDTVTDFL